MAIRVYGALRCAYVVESVNKLTAKVSQEV